MRELKYFLSKKSDPKRGEGMQVVAAADAEYVYLLWIVRNVHDFCHALLIWVS